MGWERISVGKALRLDEAPAALIEAVQKLIPVALERLGEGKISQEGIKNVCLEITTEDNRRAYAISDIVPRDWALPDRSKKERNLRTGLFIRQVDLDSFGEPLESPFNNCISLPRLIELVARHINHLKALRPDSIVEVTEEIRNASVVPRNRWDELEELYRQRKKREQENDA